jgi:hypothetical protein
MTPNQTDEDDNLLTPEEFQFHQRYTDNKLRAFEPKTPAASFEQFKADKPETITGVRCAGCTKHKKIATTKNNMK